MTRPRARPTLRLLRDDLQSGWDSPHPRRLLAEGQLDALSPLSELPHPIIAKALDCFPDDPAQHNYVGPIVSSTTVPLLEIKIDQWRGAVWVEPSTGVCWLVAAGLAKGGHDDRDDFYQRIKRADDRGDIASWLPDGDDQRILKRETASSLLVDWEVEIQRRVLEALSRVGVGGSVAFEIPHPTRTEENFGSVELELAVVTEPDYEAEEIVLDIVLDNRLLGSHLGWVATLRTLISICPPESGWDREGHTYSTIADVGHAAARLAELKELCEGGELPASTPNDRSHHTHVKTLADSMVEGKGVRSLCGIFFVPTQDHEKLPICPTCQERYKALPA